MLERKEIISDSGCEDLAVAISVQAVDDYKKVYAKVLKGKKISAKEIKNFNESVIFFNSNYAVSLVGTALKDIYHRVKSELEEQYGSKRALIDTQLLCE